MEIEGIVQKIVDLLTVYGLKVIAAVAIFVIGRWVAKGLKKVVRRGLEKGKVDPTLVSFLVNLTYFAVLGAAGLAIGLALQGSLSNFAAGFILIIFRHFQVGDYIEGAGTAGTVEALQIFTTRLKTPDNKTIIVPNSKLTGDNIINWSAKGTRRVDLTMGIGYGDDIDKARRVMGEIIAADERILKDPAPLIAVRELADSSVNFTVRSWVKLDDYWNVYFDLTEKFKKAFDAEGIGIPFPQRDVHVYRHDLEN